jgi:hypothetical protein
MRPPFDGPMGGFGRHGRHFGPFGGQWGQAPTPEQQAFWQEASALRHQLMATMSTAVNDPATLAKVKEILSQARVALAALASQSGTSTQGGDTTPTSSI